jgi:hypothetical protein
MSNNSKVLAVLASLEVAGVETIASESGLHVASVTAYLAGLARSGRVTALGGGLWTAAQHG